MVFSNLPTVDERFKQTRGNSTYTFHPVAVPVPGEALTLNGLLCAPTNRSGYYYNTIHPKQRIVLHFTAGGLSGDMETLTKQDHHVSVPFVIARDGTIYQLYSSAYWSGNLGKDAVGNSGTSNAQDKCTIGIELSNYGPLHLQEGVLKTVYGDPYCTLAQTTAYQKLDHPFRGESYFATFPDAQYESLVVLLRFLTKQYQIPRQFLPEAKRYLTINEVVDFKGIVSHINYRPVSSGKWDLGPAFDWARVIRDVQAPVFVQPETRDVEFFDEPILTSEAALIPLLPQAASSATENDPYEDGAFEAEGVVNTPNN